jgi:hypothetical protein
MNKIRICCNKGTAFMESESTQSKWFDHGKNLQSRISTEKMGQRVTSSKESSTLWIEKTPKFTIFSQNQNSF